MGGVGVGGGKGAEDGVIWKVAGSAVAISSAVTQWTVRQTDKQGRMLTLTDSQTGAMVAAGCLMMSVLINGDFKKIH